MGRDNSATRRINNTRQINTRWINTIEWINKSTPIYVRKIKENRMKLIISTIVLFIITIFLSLYDPKLGLISLIISILSLLILLLIRNN